MDDLLEVVCGILVAGIMLLARDPRCLVLAQWRPHAQWSSVVEAPFGLRCGGDELRLECKPCTRSLVARLMVRDDDALPESIRRSVPTFVPVMPTWQREVFLLSFILKLDRALVWRPWSGPPWTSA